MDRACKCGGMNDECLYCGGTGLVEDRKIEIIKTVVDKSKIKKENSELESYLHSRPEKIYVSNKKSIPQKNKKRAIVKTLKEIKIEDQLKFIGPKNPNRDRLGDTRKLAKKKSAKAAKLKTKKKEANTKVENGPELEFLVFWKNNIQHKTKGSNEFQECLSLFLKLKEGKREKFKHGIVKKKPSGKSDIMVIAHQVFDKLTSGEYKI